MALAIIRAGGETLHRSTTRQGRAVALAAACLTSALALAQAPAATDSVNIKRPTELREAPGDTSPSRGALAVATPVTRLGARQGPWIEVRTVQGLTGWVHMFDVGSSVPAQGGNTATGALRGLTSFFSKGTAQAPATTTATATIGIRGLGAEDIANAQPNLEAVAQAESQRADGVRARQYAADASLTAQVVEALPEPPPATRSAPAAAGTPVGSGGGNTGPSPSRMDR
jgi:hypothetical protein